MGDIKNSVHTCFHCGNSGVLNFIGHTRWNDEDVIYNDNGEIISYNVLEHEDWYIFECPVCNRPVVIRQDTFDIAEYTYQPVTVYPSVMVFSDGVPKEIYSAFEAAIRTKGIDYAICMLSLRRVLEMICKEKDAKGKDLEGMIDNLIEKGILSPAFSDACWVIRQLGNSAAHADKTDIYAYQVDQVIEYVSTIINYLYSMPFRVGKLKENIEAQKAAEKKRKKDAKNEE
jgi:hypothetical protein